MEVTYLCPIPLTVVGGVRMFYIQAEILNALGVSSFVYHPDKPEFLCDWFEHSLVLRKAQVFTQSKDILIIPEMWALSYGAHCMESRMRYGIFVQNGYQLDHELKPGLEQKLRDVYRNASVVMTISAEVEKFLKLAFPDLNPQKMFRCVPYISSGFVPKVKKKTITYMSRKLPRQSEMVCFFLKQYLPPDWSLVRIENVTDQELRNLLGESSIFMSFSEFEGLAAPPLEAAFAGNAVVGYTGGGGDEYFEEPIFKRIENGNIPQFIQGVLDAIERCESFGHSEAVTRQRQRLLERFGAGALRTNVQNLSAALAATFRPTHV